jgi:hypothetical protein
MISIESRFLLYMHVAVLVNTSLFILFGVTTDSVALDDMLILDVASVSNITIEKTYPYDKNTGVNDDSPTDKETFGKGNNEKSLSTGAIIGISVGCVVTVSEYYCY